MKRLLSSLTVCVLAAGILLALPATARASFVANKIIDDSVFEDVSTMSAAQIDSFINQFPSSCISTNNGFGAPDPAGYSPSTGYTYGGTVSAGNVIAHAASAYGLNPRVLLTTLQKEQGLVTGGSGCSTLRYAAAVGYGCPDSGTTYSYSGLNLYSINGNAVTSVSGTCVNSSLKAGFTQQVIRAAWLLRFGEERSKGNIGWAVVKPGWDNSDDPQSCYGGPMTQGNYVRCPSGSATYYDGYITIDGSSTHMDDGATAALYWYTPHFHGNQTFVSIWENWFGVNSMYTPSFAWQSQGVKIMDEGKNAEIPTDFMHNGDRLYATVSAKNTGSVTWTRDGANPARLGTVYPFNKLTPYCDSTWIQCNRAASMTEATVAPGDTGHFGFYMAVPNRAGTFRDYFEPVMEYQSWMSNDAGFNIYVRNTNQFDWQWQYYDAWTDSSKTTPVNVDNVTRNQSIYIELHIKNISARVWSNSGGNPTRVGVYSPYDKNSPLCTAGWVTCNRPATMTEASVAPGQSGTFSFTVKAPGTLGVYREYIKPVIENQSWSRDDNNHIYLNVRN